VFCRADGMALVSDSDSLSGDAGIAKFRSAAVSSEIETSILPRTTDAATSGGTSPTVVLPAQPSSGTRKLSGLRTRATVLVIAVVALVVALGLGSYFYFARKTTAIESIAVLPFENQSNDPKSDYLADGITESIINSLSQLPNLKVMARTTVFRYKGKETDAQKVGKELGVAAVLTGK